MLLILIQTYRLTGDDMNNLIKNLLNNKTIVITGSLIILLLIGLLAFSSKEEGAHSSSNNISNEVSDNASTTTSSVDGLLSSYEVYDDSIIYLLKDSQGKFSFRTDNNSILYETDDNISYFRVFNSNEIVYMTSSLNLTTNKNLSEVKIINLSDKSEILLYSGEELHFDVSKDVIYIIDAYTGDVMYGKDKNLKKYSLNKKINKVISNKGKVFAVNYSAINDTVRSIVYLLDEGVAKEVIVTEGKVDSISVDYNNDNLIYYSSKQLDNTVNVYSKYILNLSASSDGTNIHSDLTNNIYSVKDKYLTIDKSTNELILLNDNLYLSKRLSKIHEGTLNSMLKESSNGEYIYYFDTNGNISKL